MNVLKTTAALPRHFRLLGKQSLTAVMFVVCGIFTLVTWGLLDVLHQGVLENTVTQEWQERFAREAFNQRTRIKRSIAAYGDTAIYLASYPELSQRLRHWNRLRDSYDAPEANQWQPDWLGRADSLDGNIVIDYAIVFGYNRQRLATYKKDRHPFPEALAGIASSVVESASGQPGIMLAGDVPMLLAAQPIKDDGATVTGTLLIASRIDNAFLTDIVESESERTATGLMLGSTQKPVAVSSSRLAEAYSGSQSDFGQRFSLISNELLIESPDGTGLRHAMWFDRQYATLLGQPYLLSVRQQRLYVIMVFLSLLVTTLIWIRSRISGIQRRVDTYARRLGVVLIPERNPGDQLERLKSNIERMSEEVIAETYALEYQAQHDNLTNLPNRSLLFERLETELHNAQDDGEPLALCIMDLDQFKEVNDTLGHHIGDRLLQEVGRRLVSVLRRTDTVSRLGGDEFAVLLPGADYQRSKAICRKIIAAMDRPIKIENLRLRACISIGVALCPEHGQDGNLLLQHADVAMYEAKRAQTGFAFYMAERDEHSISRLGLAGELNDAIKGNQLMLEYQPMVDIKTGRIFCAEALVRWCHPEYGCIPPDEFISTAEQTGVIRPLTLWVMDQALGQSRSWQSVGIDLKISINLSVRSLADRKLPDQVQALVDKHNVDPRRVILEITESAIMSDPLTARRVMRRLSNMGFHLSIDDFGTGYSSLSYLKQLPVDEIKIDKSFVTQMDSEENDAVIVRATIDLAHNLGLKVVAEGVESTDVWDLLEMLGCDTAQGYFIRKPVGPHELAEWIRSKQRSKDRWLKPVGLAG